MPEIGQQPKKSKYWGNAQFNEIEDKKYINVSLDIVNSIDLAQKLSEKNISFSAINNEELSTASLVVSTREYAKASKIIRDNVKELMPNTDLQDKSWGNVKYSDIENRAFINIGSSAAAKINLGQLLNENQIQFSARDNASVQVTSLVVNKTDEDRVKGIIKNALAPSQTAPKQQHSKITVSSDMRAEIGKQLLDKNIDFSSSVNEQNKTASFTVNTKDIPILNDILKTISKNQTQKVDNNIDKTFSVSNEVKLEVAKGLMDKDISFSTHSNSQNTEFTLVNDSDIEKMAEVMKNIGSNEKTYEAPIVENSAHTNENTVAKEITISKTTETVPDNTLISAEDDKVFVPVEPTPLDTTINALKQVAEINGIDLSENSQSAVARAVNLLRDIQDNNFTANEPMNNITNVQNTPLDFGEKITPILKMSVNNHENTLKRFAEKNDTLSSKISKNENRIEALKNEVESIKHNNSLLTAMKKIPVVSVVASAMIEQNNKKIENILNVKIPQREQKIAKHTTKLEKNNMKIDKVMGKLKELSAVNKFITNFKNMNTDERRQGFIDGLTAVTQNSLNRIQTKQNKAVSQLNDIADSINSGNLSITQLSSQIEKITKLIDTIEEQQGKVQKTNSLLDNLVKVANGELLQDKEKLDTVMDTTENVIAVAVADTVNKDSVEVENIAENISDSVVEIASVVVEQAVTRELENNQKDTPVQEANVYDNVVDNVNETIPTEDEEIENNSSKIITDIIEEVASLCEVDVNILLQLPIETQDKIAEMYSNNITDDGLLDAEMMQETVYDVLSDINVNEQEEPKESNDNNFFNRDNSDTVLNREELPVNPEPFVTENKEQKILTELASITSFTISQLNSLPKDIKTDIIAEYELNGGKIDTDSFAKNIADILHVEIPKVEETISSNVNIQTESKEKDNPLKTVEELIEGNANSIDGVINNLPPEKDNQEQNQSKDKPVKAVTQEQHQKNFRFSVNDLFSSRYASRSTKEQQEQNNDRKKSNEWGL